MVEVASTVRVARPAAHAFDVVVRHQAENHPRWEDEVDEVRDLDGIAGVGHRSVMVRTEYGRTRERVTECVEYVDGQRAAYSHANAGMDFWISFDFVDVAPGASEVTATVRFRLKGVMRVLTPLIRRDAPRRGARITRRMGQVIEETPAYSERSTHEVS